MNAVSAMAYCQKVHDIRQCPVVVGSPQTEAQREQVVRVITALTQHRAEQQLRFQQQKQEQILQQQQQIEIMEVVAHSNAQLVSDVTDSSISQTSKQGSEALQTSSIPVSAAAISVEKLGSSAGIAIVGIKMPTATPPGTPPSSAGRQRNNRHLQPPLTGATATASASVSPPQNTNTVEMQQQNTNSILPSLPQQGENSSNSRPNSGKQQPMFPNKISEVKSTIEIAPLLSAALNGLENSGIPVSSASLDTQASEVSEQWLKSLSPMQIETIGSKTPNIAAMPYPLNRMPTEKLKTEYLISSAPSSAESRQRRRSKIDTMPNESISMDISRENDQIVASPPTGPPPRRPSNGGSFVGSRRNSKGPSLSSASEVPAVLEDSPPKSQGGSTDGHTTTSEQESGDFDDSNIVIQNSNPFKQSGDNLKPDADINTDAMEIDNDTDPNSNSSTRVAVGVLPLTTKHSSATSTFLGINFNRKT